MPRHTVYLTVFVTKLFVTKRGFGMVRLAAFDMDGTLLMPNHQVGAETLDALHRLSEIRLR